MSIKDAIPSYCEKCGNRYTEQDIFVQEIQPNGAEVRCTCRRCRHSVVMRLAPQFTGPSGAGLMGAKKTFKSDLNINEMSALSSKNPISDAELLEFYEALSYINTSDDIPEQNLR